MKLQPGISFKSLTAGLISLLGVISFEAVAQQKADNTIQSIERNKTDNTPTSIRFAAGANWRMDQAQEIFKKYLNIDGVDNTMVLKYTTNSKNNVTAQRYQQFYKGLQVEFATYSLTIKDGIVAFITGNTFDFKTSLNEVPALTESDAFTKALKFVGADKYMWQDPLEEQRIKHMFHKADTTFLPKGKLVWVEDYRSGNANGDRNIHLAWSFDIFAASPLSREVVYVDAQTGKILLSNSMIKHTATTGYTKYSGSVPIETSIVGATFELYDSTRGSGVHTLNMNNGSSYGAATEYTSVTNAWPVAAPDSIAIDAHWGAEIVYDFWKNVMGRLSYDNADGILMQYVHYSSGYNNAFWDGAEMTYGDGTGCGSGFTALASLDVTGHEIGHGVCQYTANLVYASESGAMNEAFSDCWGSTIEAWGDPHEVDAVAKSTWGIGEEIKCGNPMRRMDFPKLKGQPDTYGGTNWFNVVSCTPSGGNDECGVHNNSGVMNKWYYLVVMGGTGTNDLANAYNVTGIGFAEARNILYQTELVLSSTADYAQMRTTSINTTITLYGDCSPEVITVTNAWYAVGVGAAYVAYPANIAGSVNICIGGTATLTDATPGGVWSSVLLTVATVGPLSGVVSGIGAGTTQISYSMGGACVATTIATVNAFPTATITPSGTTVLCTGSTLMLTATAGVGYTYQWKLGGVNIPGATNMTYTATATGNYTVVISNSASCSSTSAVTIVNSATPPLATITPATSTTFCVGGSVVLNANSGAGYTYQWQLGGSPIAGATNISYTASAAGNYTVVVTNPAGCSTTSTAATVTVLPMPTSAITPAGPTTFCAPGSVALNANTGGGLTYQWQLGGASIGGATGSSYTASGSGNYTVIVTQTGCSTLSSPVTVTAQVLAVAPITGTSSVCMGSTTPLADATAGGTWISGNMGTAIVNASGVVTGVAAGIVPISYSFTNTCGTIVATVNVVVHAPDVVAPISGALSVCQGSTTSLADVTPSGVWSSGTPGTFTVSSTGVVSGVAAGSATVSYTVTNSFGCVSSAIATVIVRPLASPALTPGGSVAICPGGNILLSASAGAGYSYQWQMAGVAVSGATNISYTATSAGSFRAIITNGFGCISISNTVIVNTDPSLLVTPSVIVNASPGNILCLVPSPVSFTASAVNGGSAPLFQWFVNGAGAGMGASFGYTPASGDIVKCLVTSNDACASPDTGSTIVNMLISTMRTPSVSITSNPSLICAGNSVIFTANPVYGGTAPTYRWSRNDTNIATGPDYVYIPHNGDVLKVRLVSNYPCLLVDTAISIAYHVVVHNPVTNMLNITVTQSGIMQGSVDTFVANPINGGGSPVYQWLLNGIAIPGANSSMYITSTLAPGDIISCKETSSLPCASPATATSGGISVKVTPVGVQTIGASGNFTLAPNPSKGIFDIKGSLKSITDEKVTIVITDLPGQVVYSKVSQSQNGMVNEHIVMDNSLANGIYVLSITTAQGHEVFQLVIDK